MMDVAGTSAWEMWKQEQLNSGQPLFEEEEKVKMLEEARVLGKSPLPPSWQEWKRARDDEVQRNIEADSIIPPEPPVPLVRPGTILP
jgi:hypothetical protein